MVKPTGVDVHAHFFPESFIRVIEEAGASFGASVDRSNPKGPVLVVGGSRTAPLDARYWDLGLRIKAMNRQGVAVQALSLTAPMVYWADGATGARLSAAWNDGASAAHVGASRSLRRLRHGAASRSAARPRRARARGEAARHPRRVHGHECRRSRAVRSWTSSRLRASGRAWACPCSSIRSGSSARSGLLPTISNNFLGNPFDTAIAAAHLVFGGVLDRLPKLTVCLPHAGGALPYLHGRLRHGQGVRPETKGAAKKSFSAYLRRFTYDIISHDAPALRYLVDTVGADRVMLGTDFCFDMGLERPLVHHPSEGDRAQPQGPGTRRPHQRRPHARVCE